MSANLSGNRKLDNSPKVLKRKNLQHEVSVKHEALTLTSHFVLSVELGNHCMQSVSTI